MVKILDCTTRDGGHDTNWNFDKNFVESLILCLNKTGIQYYEIGYRNNLDRKNKGEFYYCDPEFLHQFSSIKKGLNIGVMVDTSRFCINDFQDGKKDFADFVRIATHPDKIRITLDYAHELHNKNYKVIVQLMEIPNVNKEHYKILENWEHKEILECLYIADSYSTVTPSEIKTYFDKLKSIGYKRISFHAHDKHSLALQNTLKAIELGAYSVDVTLNGMGKNLDAIKLLENTTKYNSKYYKELSLL